MTSERDLAELIDAIDQGNDAAARTALQKLLLGFLADIRRIAAAVERIETKLGSSRET
jgi:hypothetical protein